MLNTILRYYHTLKYLRWIQIKHRLLYSIFKPNLKRNIVQYDAIVKEDKPKLKLQKSITAAAAYLGTYTFSFLNVEQEFKLGIDWNCLTHGKLWTYNLNYFEYLSQANISRNEGLELILDFINNEEIIKDGIEPFPISLRMIFWIKFLVKHQIEDEAINESMFKQLQILSARPEYHLMGNHLLENGFGLLFGGCYLNNEKFISQAKNILVEQLEEQILPDGAHFELSPMYHQLMLYRLLDCINLLQQNPNIELKNLNNIFCQKAEIMLGWLLEMIFENGDLPRLNDSTGGIAPDTDQLIDYANSLGLKSQKITLKESGYRKMKNRNFELLMDVGHIGPDYIPGHAHSDTFNFVLHYQGKPLIIDTGISTYEKNLKRNQERSTFSHNTVAIAGKEQSEVWGGFRVARRANVFNLLESDNRISASHDGYFRIFTHHHRTFLCEEDSIIIQDEVFNESKAQAFLHFHPEIEVMLVGNEIHGESWKIIFDNLTNIELKQFQYASGFNRTISSKKAILTFNTKLQTKIIKS